MSHMKDRYTHIHIALEGLQYSCLVLLIKD